MYERKMRNLVSKCCGKILLLMIVLTNVQALPGVRLKRAAKNGQIQKNGQAQKNGQPQVDSRDRHVVNLFRQKALSDGFESLARYISPQRELAGNISPQRELAGNISPQRSPAGKKQGPRQSWKQEALSHRRKGSIKRGGGGGGLLNLELFLRRHQFGRLLKLPLPSALLRPRADRVQELREILLVARLRQLLRKMLLGRLNSADERIMAEVEGTYGGERRKRQAKYGNLGQGPVYKPVRNLDLSAWDVVGTITFPSLTTATTTTTTTTTTVAKNNDLVLNQSSKSKDLVAKFKTTKRETSLRTEKGQDFAQKVTKNFSQKNTAKNSDLAHKKIFSAKQSSTKSQDLAERKTTCKPRNSQTKTKNRNLEQNKKASTKNGKYIAQKKTTSNKDLAQTKVEKGQDLAQKKTTKKQDLAKKKTPRSQDLAQMKTSNNQDLAKKKTPIKQDLAQKEATKNQDLAQIKTTMVLNNTQRKASKSQDLAQKSTPKSQDLSQKQASPKQYIVQKKTTKSKDLAQKKATDSNGLAQKRTLEHHDLAQKKVQMKKDLAVKGFPRKVAAPKKFAWPVKQIVLNKKGESQNIVAKRNEDQDLGQISLSKNQNKDPLGQKTTKGKDLLLKNNTNSLVLEAQKSTAGQDLRQEAASKNKDLSVQVTTKRIHFTDHETSRIPGQDLIVHGNAEYREATKDSVAAEKVKKVPNGQGESTPRENDLSNEKEKPNNDNNKQTLTKTTKKWNIGKPSKQNKRKSMKQGRNLSLSDRDRGKLKDEIKENVDSRKTTAMSSSEKRNRVNQETPRNSGEATPQTKIDRSKEKEIGPNIGEDLKKKEKKDNTPMPTVQDASKVSKLVKLRIRNLPKELKTTEKGDLNAVKLPGQKLTSGTTTQDLKKGTAKNKDLVGTQSQIAGSKEMTVGEASRDGGARYTLGRYPHESEDLIKGIEYLVNKLAEKEPELISDKVFPPATNCTQCPDFDVCIVALGKLRCVRRTLDHEPCPELCPEVNVDRFKKQRKKWKEKKRKALEEMMDKGNIPEVDKCEDNCKKDSICIPSRNKFHCIPATLLNPYEDPCGELCKSDVQKGGKKCRILGNECVLTSKEADGGVTKNKETKSSKEVDKKKGRSEETKLNKSTERRFTNMGIKRETTEHSDEKKVSEGDASKEITKINIDSSKKRFTKPMFTKKRNGAIKPMEIKSAKGKIASKEEHSKEKQNTKSHENLKKFLEKVTPEGKNDGKSKEQLKRVPSGEAIRTIEPRGIIGKIDSKEIKSIEKQSKLAGTLSKETSSKSVEGEGRQETRLPSPVNSKESPPKGQIEKHSPKSKEITPKLFKRDSYKKKSPIILQNSQDLFTKPNFSNRPLKKTKRKLLKSKESTDVEHKGGKKRKLAPKKNNQMHDRFSPSNKFSRPIFAPKATSKPKKKADIGSEENTKVVTRKIFEKARTKPSFHVEKKIKERQEMKLKKKQEMKKEQQRKLDDEENRQVIREDILKSKEKGPVSIEGRKLHNSKEILSEEENKRKHENTAKKLARTPEKAFISRETSQKPKSVDDRKVNRNKERGKQNESAEQSKEKGSKEGGTSSKKLARTPKTVISGNEAPSKPQGINDRKMNRYKDRGKENESAKQSKEKGRKEKEKGRKKKPPSHSKEINSMLKTPFGSTKCEECSEEKMACIKLDKETATCVDEDLVANQNCMDLCPRAMKLTKSCEIEPPGNHTIKGRFTMTNFTTISCESTTGQKKCDKCGKDNGCVTIENYQETCTWNPSCDLCPKYTNCREEKVRGKDKVNIVCSVKKKFSPENEEKKADKVLQEPLADLASGRQEWRREKEKKTEKQEKTKKSSNNSAERKQHGDGTKKHENEDNVKKKDIGRSQAQEGSKGDAGLAKAIEGKMGSGGDSDSNKGKVKTEESEKSKSMVKEVEELRKVRKENNKRRRDDDERRKSRKKSNDGIKDLEIEQSKEVTAMNSGKRKTQNGKSSEQKKEKEKPELETDTNREGKQMTTHGPTGNHNGGHLCHECPGSNSTMQRQQVQLQNCLEIGTDAPDNSICLDPLVGSQGCQEGVCGPVLKCHMDMDVAKDGEEGGNHVRFMHRYQCTLPGKSKTEIKTIQDCSKCPKDSSSCLRIGSKFECLAIPDLSEDNCAEKVCPKGAECQMKEKVVTCLAKRSDVKKVNKMAEKPSDMDEEKVKDLIKESIRHYKAKTEHAREDTTPSNPGLYSLPDAKGSNDKPIKSDRVQSGDPIEKITQQGHEEGAADREEWAAAEEKVKAELGLDALPVQDIHRREAGYEYDEESSESLNTDEEQLFQILNKGDTDIEDSYFDPLESRSSQNDPLNDPANVAKQDNSDMKMADQDVIEPEIDIGAGIVESPLEPLKILEKNRFHKVSAQDIEGFDYFLENGDDLPELEAVALHAPDLDSNGSMVSDSVERIQFDKGAPGGADYQNGEKGATPGQNSRGMNRINRK